MGGRHRRNPHLQHLEYQNEILMRMVAKLGVDLREGLART